MLADVAQGESALSARPIYLDNNATTPLDPRVLQRMNKCFVDAFANPGSAHSFGRAARQVLEDSRESIADILNADASELIFTSGGTESINMAVHGFTIGRKGLIACTDGEHPATLEACTNAAFNGIGRVSIPVDSEGRIRTGSLSELPWKDLRLVCVILAHNETGVIQDVTELSRRCRQHGVPLLLDAVQAVGKIPVDFSATGAAALAFGAHKFHGPRGIGGLLLRRGIKLPSLLSGGHQESGRRAGTEAVPLIAGMACSLERWRDEATERIALMRSLRDQLQESLLDGCSPIVVHALNAERLPNTLSVAFPGVPGEALLVNLHLAGVACSLGSTCASGSMEPAKALLAMGVEPEICKSSVRFSVSCQNTSTEIEDAARRIVAIVHQMRLEKVH
ncbi:MAG: cysteine desulfurase family protein [Planctomycetaceae bacterium]